MPKEPITKTLKWLMAIGAFAIIGLLYFAYLDTNDQLDLAGMRQYWPAKKKTTTTTTTASDIPADWKKFDEANYGFSFRYPKDWTVDSKSNNNGQKIVALLTPSNTKLTISNPSVVTGFEGWTTTEEKNLTTTAGLEFKRTYGGPSASNENKTTYLYKALYGTASPGNAGSTSVLFVAETSQLQTSAIDQLDSVVKSFAFSDETAGWKTYTNSTYGFSFRYPTDTTFSDETSKLNNSVTVLLWVTVDKPSASKEPVSEDAKDYYTISMRVNKGNIDEAEKLNALQSVSKTERTIADLSGRYYSTHGVGQEGSKGQAAIVSKGDYSYFLSITSPDINSHSRIFSQVLSSFAFTK